MLRCYIAYECWAPMRKIISFERTFFVGLFAVAGVMLLIVSSAATFFASLEAEEGTRQGDITIISDAEASNGQAVRFGSTTTNLINHTYQEDTSDFINPERGFSQFGGSPSAARSANMSLILAIFRLDNFKNGPISSTYLQQTVTKTFTDARNGGVKIIPRFTYNNPSAWPINPSTDGDAPLSVVLGHLDQLQPILQQNADVIAYMEAGFIGAWGEWHSSTNNLTTLSNKTTILNKILSVLPNRAVTLRVPADKQAIYNRSTPLTSTEAFSGSNISRTGHHNDCFLASPDDMGTYDLSKIAQQKAYLSTENLYLPQGGETCSNDSAAQPYIGCTNAQNELNNLRWSRLNSAYHQGVLDLWRQQGCYQTISKSLGYRIRLVNASISETLKPGGEFQVTINLRNDGYGVPYNPRGLEVMLRNKQTQAVYKLALDNDPRRWGPSTPQSVTVTAGIPVNMPAGQYDIFLHLPDPASALYGKPAYSIRLANTGTWEASTGYNSLQAVLTVNPSASGPSYSGSNFFVPK